MRVVYPVRVALAQRIVLGDEQHSSTVTYKGSSPEMQERVLLGEGGIGIREATGARLASSKSSKLPMWPPEGDDS